MADVFISYKRANRAIAESLSKVIAAKGYSVWWDHSIIAGEQFNAAIDRELKLAGCVVTLWTTEAMQSKWVVAEAVFAFGRSVLISARLDHVDLEYPFQIIQAADLRDWDGSDATHAGVADILAGIALKVGEREGEMATEGAPDEPDKPVAKPRDPRAALPSMGWRPDTDFFAERFAQTFPGLRSVTWFDDPAAIAMRLDKLFEAPLDFAEGTPIWWLRGSSNLHIEKYRRLDERLILLNWEELRVRRIAACPNQVYQRVFVYLEAEGMPPTGLYPDDGERTRRLHDLQGYSTEEYAIFDEHHLLTRDEYDDGAALIDGKLVDTRGKTELRVRHLSPYNIVIAANGSPLNNSKYDERLESHLNEALKSDVDATRVLDQIIDELWKLPVRGRD